MVRSYCGKDDAFLPTTYERRDFLSWGMNQLNLHFPKMNKPPKNVEYLLSTSQHRKIAQGAEWDTREDQEEEDN